jgi:Flp pilus assembly protein TadD
LTKAERIADARQAISILIELLRQESNPAKIAAYSELLEQKRKDLARLLTSQKPPESL